MGPLPWSAEQNDGADNGASERGIGPRPHGAASGTPAKAHARTARRDRASARSACAVLRADTDQVARDPAAIRLVRGPARPSCAALAGMHR